MNGSTGKNKTGLVQIYTGEGKGKTTAAMGLALRATGQGLRVIMLQFIKGDPDCGEHYFTGKNQSFEIVQTNKFKGPVSRQPREELKAAVEKALELARGYLTGGRYDVVILDEIFIALGFGLVSIENILDLMEQKKDNVELVMTGRGAPPEIVKRADLVTEMLMIKHPYTDGVTARRGIEY
ncbi:MAG: cob(I)yrinic acid a,c-diamide adenosyltransferase [Dehalococcoidia bacterium]|nr:cob(I)yrinic acid a,c-diamide adenosyltransferase [Dehalococcoidia bacterium]MDZ4247216.1 cob(I)yrinic acid a,c-diamide adenosyltransferase [Dehalococcoidia bacterium]